MSFHSHRPAFPMVQFIENLSYFDDVTRLHNLDRFLPERPQHIYHNKTLQEIQTCRYAWVSGVRAQPMTIPSDTGGWMLVAAFKKAKTYPFDPFPIQEPTDA